MSDKNTYTLPKDKKVEEKNSEIENRENQETVNTKAKIIRDTRRSF